jgi:hypothetical protein
MAEILTTEIILSCSIATVILLAALNSLTALRAPRLKAQEVDIEAAVRNAPYHLLESIGLRLDPQSGLPSAAGPKG